MGTAKGRSALCGVGWVEDKEVVAVVTRTLNSYPRFEMKKFNSAKRARCISHMTPVVALDSDSSPMLKSASSALTTPKIRSTQYVKQG